MESDFRPLCYKDPLLLLENIAAPYSEGVTLQEKASSCDESHFVTTKLCN